MNSQARKRMPMLAALLLIALLALMPSLRSAPPALPLAVTDIGLADSLELPAADAQDASRSLADQLAYDDTPVLPAAPWRPTRMAPIWLEPAAWHGAGTHPRPRLRPPSA